MMFDSLPIASLPVAAAAVKASVILALALAASFLLRRASASARHLVWTLALAAALAVPVLSSALPSWQVPLIRLEAPDSPAVDASDPVPAVRHSRVGTRVPRSGATATSASPEAGATPAQAVSLATLLAGVTWTQVLLGVWAAGFLAIATRIAAGFVALGWLARRTDPAAGAAWLPLAQKLAADIGVTTSVRFLRSARASMPLAAGLFRPAVIMPADADTWTRGRLRVVLLHELAHVKRRDCLTHLVAQAACAVYWFNPLAWMAARRARAERERACDDLVLACGTRGSDYAGELLDIARGMRRDRWSGVLAGASLAMARPSQLEGRLMAILDPRLPRRGPSRGRASAGALLCCAVVAPLGALQPWAEPHDAAPAAAVTTSSGPAIPSLAAPPPAPAVQASAAPVPAPAPQPAPGPQPRQSLPVVADVSGSIAAIAGEAVAEALEGGVIDDAIERAIDEEQEAAPAGGRADARTIAALTAALKDADKGVRETAMQALVQLRDPAIVEPLLQALKDPSEEVREQAVFGLGQLRDKRAVEPLAAALKDTSADVREQAAFALGQVRDRSATAPLSAALKDAVPDVREQAAFALGQLRDPAAVDALAVAVRDANPSVREQAVFALSQLRDRRAVEPLISALKDAHADVREQAAFALGQIRDRGAVEALVVALKDTDADVREQIAFALGQIRDPRAIDALTAALKDASADVRQQAAFALGQLAR